MPGLMALTRILRSLRSRIQLRALRSHGGFGSRCKHAQAGLPTVVA